TALRPPLLRRTLAAVSACLLLYCSLVTGARAGLVASLVFLGLLVIGLSAILRKSSAPMWSSIFLGLLVLSIPFLCYFPSMRPLLGQRAELYESGFKVWLLSPIFGGGVESFGFWNDTVLRSLGFQRTYGSTHNFMLQVLSGMGIAGFLFMTYLVVRTMRICHHWLARGERLAPALIWAGLGAILAYGAFQEWWYLRGVQLNFWLAIFAPGILSERMLRSERNAKANRGKARGYILGGVAIVVIVIAGAVSFWNSKNLKERYRIFENVGHLERTDQGLRYPLLRGDGQFVLKGPDGQETIPFQCSMPKVITGMHDPRLICRYESIKPEEAVEKLP
ncbi:MAG: O-antigen ligase family protein, partial [Leptospiraceae bacterium]|nr:O-antigen ligase family protein [Leptospiraceae bacterium]